jgi:hypothetical protein
MNYTSRSNIEDFQSCPRLRFNNQFLLGKGLVAKRRSVPLVTGTAVHSGVSHLLNRARIGQEADVDLAVQLAVTQYVNDCEEAGFRGKDMEKDAQQKFTFGEQKALVEGLIRAWYFKEFPRIVERYRILAVEREIEPIKLVEDVYFQARIDAEMQELNTGEYTNYSLKTCKQWDERMEESYKSDLQGITEIWAVEEDSRRREVGVKEIISRVQGLIDSGQYPSKNLYAIRDWFGKQPEASRAVMAIRFCYLVKGKTYNDRYDENSLTRTYSPLIRGYRNITPGGILYAHSWSYPNPENKSGKGTLGKGWQPFNVWESDIGIKNWIQALNDNLIQPENGDILKQQVVTPIELFRNEGEIKEGIEEIKAQEGHIFTSMDCISRVTKEEIPNMMASYFPHNRKHCFFHFGGRCEYYDLCWKPEVAADPIGSGIYEIRTPHHAAERKELE